MRRQKTLTVSCGRVLKAKVQTGIVTQVQSDDEDDGESIASSNYISNDGEEDTVQTYHITLIEDGEVEEEEGKMLLQNLRRALKPPSMNLKKVI
ncbi:UNVERIFIED_CONTAM: hypothetical protein Sangu_2917900 [Sesamum angustifolium]|uniref:Uncharacterized protein n=1 Tax=Sesamum angustifolium TaxID=2727405 RepID=A0AAW2ILM6_9LAMI